MVTRRLKEGKKGVIAYFTMEIGISHTIPTYAGGLGILAGDLLKSYADLQIPVVGVTLLNEHGYFAQEIDEEGNQAERPVRWNPSEIMEPLPGTVTVDIAGRDVKVRAWRQKVRGVTASEVPVYFLDTNIEGNNEYERSLTSSLYGGDQAYRLAQEIILGVAGVRILEAEGHTVMKYHLNEGHAALLIVELLRRTFRDAPNDEERYDLEAVRERCVFTTHTPVAAGHDRFEEKLFRQVTDGFVPEHVLRDAIHDGLVNMTLLALNNSKYVNGVAKKHGEVTKELFPGHLIHSITNGIHPPSWVSPEIKRLFDTYIPGWQADPFSLRYAFVIPNEELWVAHRQAKQSLIDEVNRRSGLGFHPDRFTIGYARRFTEYKRPDLALFDVERLRRVAETVGDLQLIYAGKAHSRDTRGKELIKKVIAAARAINEAGGRLKVVFLEQYDMKLARLLVGGCDVWLNTPQRPFEASGTSGMKAAVNGVPHLSTLDGWWLEGHIEGVTGWSLGPHPREAGFAVDDDPSDEAANLYAKLEETIVPTFYGQRDRWINIMKHTIALNGSFFTTARMAQQYIANAYLE